jgi:YggT family protein
MQDGLCQPVPFDCPEVCAKMHVILDPILTVLIMAINIYIWLVVAGVILSWLVAFNVINTSNNIVYMIGDFLHKITEPALKRIRRFMPDLGGIDISPMILILGLLLIQMILGNLQYEVAGSSGPLYRPGAG